MKATVVAAVAGLAAVGCGGAPPRVAPGGAAGTGGAGTGGLFAPGVLPWASGTRLRARVLDGGDGAKVFVGWHDTALDADCVFRRDTDGVLRCMPGVANVVSFSDFGCTRAYVIGDETTAPRFARQRVETTCALADEARFVPYEVSGPEEPVTSGYFFDDKGVCTRGGLALATARPYAPLDLDRLVSARLEPIAGDGPLGARLLTASDGARAALGFWSPADDQRCFVAADFIAGTDAQTCLPARAAFGQDCFASRVPGCVPTMAWNFVAPACDAATLSVFPVTGRSPMIPDLDLYCTGAALPLESLPTAMKSWAGTGRLRASYRMDGAGHRVIHDDPFAEATPHPLTAPLLRFSDGPLGGIPCRPVQTADERSFVCLDEGTRRFFMNHFADAACATTPLYDHQSACAADPVPRHVRPVADPAVLSGFPNERLGAAPVVFAVGTRHDGPYFLKLDGSCLAQDTPPAGTSTLYTLTPADLPPLVVRTE